MKTQIGKFVSRLVVTALAAVDSFFISKIKNATVQRAIRLTLAPVRETALALADDNPRNEEQVELIWKKFANADLPVYAHSEITKALEMVEDDDVRVVLETVSQPVVNMLRVVTDEDPNNKEQLRAMFEAFVKSPDTQAIAINHILFPLVEQKIKDPALRDFLLTLLRDGLLNDED